MRIISHTFRYYLRLLRLLNLNHILRLFPTPCILLLTLFTFSSCTTVSSKPLASNETIPIESVAQTPVELADQRLKAAGLSEEFILKLHKKYIDKNPDWMESVSRIAELNVYGFLSKSNYALHDSPHARKKVAAYLKSHHSSFALTNRKYPVPASVIASLLWVETKYGKSMGTFDLPWVYYALIISNHPDFLRKMISILPQKLTPEQNKESTLPFQQKIAERLPKKAAWAMDEMLAVEKIYSEYYFDPFRVRASFAGAFGLPQFIPSSYLKHSRSSFRKRANLFRDSDAIESVGNFLTEFGWKQDDGDSHEKALFAYNRSKDYGAIILKIAEGVSKK